MFNHLNIEDNRHTVLSDLLSQSSVLFTIEKWFKQTHCVIYSTIIDTVMYYYYLTSEKIRHTVLANLLC